MTASSSVFDGCATTVCGLAQRGATENPVNMQNVLPIIVHAILVKLILNSTISVF